MSAHDRERVVHADLVHVGLDRRREGFEEADIPALDLRAVGHRLFVGRHQDGVRRVVLEHAADVALVVGGDEAFDDFPHLQRGIVIGAAGEGRRRKRNEAEGQQGRREFDGCGIQSTERVL